jgi:hypothetical protein
MFGMGRRWISERHTVKVLVDSQGTIVSLTTKRISYLFIVTRPFVGIRRIRTQDRIVAKAGYDPLRTLELIKEFYPNGVR